MTTPAETPHVRITSLVDFFALLPKMLGFWPTESLAVVAIKDGKMEVAARFDIPIGDEAVLAVGHAASEVGARFDADFVVLVGFTDHPSQLWPIIDTMRVALHPLAVEALVSDSEHWWESPTDEGQPLPLEELDERHRFVGRPVLADRSALAATVAGPQRITVGHERAMRAAEWFATQLPIDDQIELAQGMVEDFLTRPGERSLADCVILATLADDPFIREELRRTIARDNAPRQLDLWHQVVDQTPDELATGALCLLAMAAWLSGDGALQSVCLDRAQALSPEDDMVCFLNDLQQQATDPRTWQE